MKKSFFERFITFITPSFEGNDRRSSYRRLSAFGIMTLYYYSSIAYFHKVIDPFWLLMLIIVHGLFFLILCGITTLQQVAELKTKFFNNKSETIKTDESDPNQV